jgi:hypothetical protein
VDLASDGSVRAVVVRPMAEAQGFRRPSPGTTVTVVITRVSPMDVGHTSTTAAGDGRNGAEAAGATLPSTGGGDDGTRPEGTAATAAPTTLESSSSTSGKPFTVTAAVCEEAFVAEVEKALGFDACHPVELTVLRMRRGETATVTVASGPGAPCAYTITLERVVSPVPLEELGAETHVRLARVALDTAERYHAAGALAWAADRYARGVRSMLLCSLLLAGSAVTGVRELADMLRMCYVGLGRCHCDRALVVDPPPADRARSLHKAIDAASRALEMDPADVDALALTERASALMKDK